MPFENLRPVRIEGSVTPLSMTPVEKSDILGAPVLVAHNPENHAHQAILHRLDEESARAGLLDKTGQPEMLQPDEFKEWNYAGSPGNFWRKLDIVVEPDSSIGFARGFINAYRMERGVKKRLAQELAARENPITLHPKATGDEIEWFIPDRQKHLEEQVVLQHISARFQQGTDFIIHWIDPEITTADDIAMLERMGFTRIYEDTYAGEESTSVCYFLDRSSFARSLQERTAAK